MLIFNPSPTALTALLHRLRGAVRAATRTFRSWRSNPMRRRGPPARPARNALVRVATMQRGPGREEPRPAASARTRSTAHQMSHVLRGEHRLIPLSEIEAAAAPSRLVYDDVEALATSIAGSAEHEGLGLLAPIVVRVREDGRFEMIDGERRLRGCRLVAQWSGVEDLLIPAMVFRVDARTARLMQLASLAQEEPKAYELALTYQGLRDAMAQGGASVASARGLTQIGRHGKTQIADYLRIADSLSAEVLAAAGLVNADGDPDPAILVELTKKQLVEVAKCTSVEARATAVRNQLDRLRGHNSVSPATDASTPPSPDERRTHIAAEKELTLKLRRPARAFAPGEARALIENEIAPAMLALVEQGHGARDAEGYYCAVSFEHACLVLPREIEGLTLEQLDRLDHTLTTLVSRTQRARDERQKLEESYRAAAEELQPEVVT